MFLQVPMQMECTVHNSISLESSYMWNKSLGVGSLGLVDGNVCSIHTEQAVGCRDIALVHTVCGIVLEHVRLETRNAGFEVDQCCRPNRRGPLEQNGFPFQLHFVTSLTNLLAISRRKLPIRIVFAQDKELNLGTF